MKKLFKIIAVTLVSLFLLILVLPYFFQDKIFNLVKEEANNTLKGELVISDFGLSLINNFPNLTLEIEGLKFTGAEMFAEEALFTIDKIAVEVDLFSAVSGNNYEIKSIAIYQPVFNIKVLKDGTANYDIIKTENEEETSSIETETVEPFNLKLKHFEIHDLDFTYTDKASDLFFSVFNLNHTLAGNFGDALVNINTNTNWAKMTFVMDGLKYLNNVHGESDFNLAYNSATETIGIEDNYVRLNTIKLGFNGSIVALPNGYNINLAYNSGESSFKDLMSLIPAVYASDMNAIKSAGNFNVNGFVKGNYLDDSEDLPEFQFNLNVNNGSFAYANLPSSLEKVSINLEIHHPKGPAENVEIDLNKFYALISKNPIEAKLSLKNIMTDPLINGFVKGDINLKHWNDIIPIDEHLEGRIAANANFSGRQSAFEAGDFNKANASGTIEVWDFKYFYTDYNLPVFIDHLKLELAPNKINLPVLKLRTAHSDYNAQGSVSNAFSWYLGDAPLSGNFTMNANLIDVNEFLGAEETPALADSTAIQEDAYEIIRVPQDLDFTVSLAANKLLYSDMTFENVKGTLSVKGGVVRVFPLDMNFKGGAFSLIGKYDATQELPQANFDFKIKDLPMASAMELSFVSAYLPIAKNIVGNLNTSLSLKTQLDKDMMPVLSTINSKGILQTKGLSYNSKVLSDLDKYFKNTDLTNIKLDEPNLSFTITDGTLSINPIRVKLGSQEFKFSGSHSLDQDLNYELQTNVPISNINLPAELSLLNLAGNAAIDIKLHVGGTMENPKITPKFGNVEMEDVVQEIIEAVKDSITTIVKNKVDEEAKKILAEAQQQADALMAEARKQAALAKAEAKKQADALKVEAQKQADALVAEAKNPFAEIAAQETSRQLIKKANKEIDKLNTEANTQADYLVKEAQKQADAILKEAKLQADKLVD